MTRAPKRPTRAAGRSCAPPGHVELQAAAAYIRPFFVSLPADDKAGERAVLQALNVPSVVDCALLLDTGHFWAVLHRALFGTAHSRGVETGLWDVVESLEQAKPASTVAIVHPEALMESAPAVLASALCLHRLQETTTPRFALCSSRAASYFAGVLDGVVPHVLLQSPFINSPGHQTGKEAAVASALVASHCPEVPAEAHRKALSAAWEALRDTLPTPDAFASFAARSLLPAWRALPPAAWGRPPALFAAVRGAVRAACTGEHVLSAGLGTFVKSLATVERFVLIAAFIASRNSPATDGRFFANVHKTAGGHIPKKRGRPLGSTAAASSEGGCASAARKDAPAVSIDRVTAIVYFVYEHVFAPPPPLWAVEAAIGRLIHLRMLSRVNQRVRVLFSRDLAVLAASSMSFDLPRYLVTPLV